MDSEIGPKARFGARFRAAREALRLKQSEVAARLGVSGAIISDWENGKSSPQLERMELIAGLLRKPIAYFFTESGDEDSGGARDPLQEVRTYSDSLKALRLVEAEHLKQVAAVRHLMKHFAARAEGALTAIPKDQRRLLHDLDPFIARVVTAEPDPPARLLVRELAAMKWFSWELTSEDASEQSPLRDPDLNLIFTSLESFLANVEWPHPEDTLSIDQERAHVLAYGDRDSHWSQERDPRSAARYDAEQLRLTADQVRKLKLVFEYLRDLEQCIHRDLEQRRFDAPQA